MGVAAKGDEGKPMADDAASSRPDNEGPDEADQRELSRHEHASSGTTAATGGGFFSIYKPGQGYWVRLGTTIAAALLITLICVFVYQTVRTRTTLDAPVADAAGVVAKAGFPVWAAGITAAVALLLTAVAWWVLNKANVVEFFIATESEMKKVNWTTRKEIIGSTKVVIGFMFIIATILFVIDVVFGYFFWMIRVLRHGPFA